MHSQEQRTLLIATGLYPPEIGGPATYTEMLEEMLPGYGVQVVTVPFGTVRHLPKLVRHAVFAWKLLKEAKRADAIYALDSISVGLPAWVVSVLARRPFLVRLGGDYAWEQGAQRFGVAQNLDEYTQNPSGVPLPVKILASIQTFVVKRARKVVAPSAYLKKVIGSWGVQEDKIVVIYSALQPLSVEASRNELREQLSYEGKVIVSVGRLVPWKGFVELIDAFASLKKEMPECTLVIIGDGPLQVSLQEKVAALGLHDSVRLVGRMGKDALGAAIKASDVFVLNTAYEGLSHQLLEVMDLGVPIVTTHVGGNIELIKDGVTGFMVAPNDVTALGEAVARLLQSEELRTRMVQHAKVRAKDFSREKVVAEFVSLLKEGVLEAV